MLPPSEVLTLADPLSKLEKFIACVIHQQDVIQLITWLSVAKHGSPTRSLSFTHFKLGLDPGPTGIGMTKTWLLDLVEALRGSPMRHLALDWVDYAEPDLFGIIAAAFPNLESLTLYYISPGLERDKFNAAYRRGVGWPHSTEEYALQLRNFKCLKHLAWNLVEANKTYHHWTHYNKPGSNKIAALQVFLEQCPSLEVVAVFNNTTVWRAYRKWCVDGHPCFQRDDPEATYIAKLYNPCPPYSFWPDT